MGLPRCAPISQTMPRVTTALIGANVAMFLLQLVAPGIMLPLALWPVGAAPAGVSASFAPWQLVTYGFLHGGLPHLAFNMFGLYMFGTAIEQVLGGGRYLTYYLVCVISAAVSHLIFAVITGAYYPILGASGGVFGLLLAYAYYFPNNRIQLIFLPIPIRAWVFVVVYGLLELFLGVTGTQAGVAHFAHLGGLIGGFALLTFWRGGRRGRSVT